MAVTRRSMPLVHRSAFRNSAKDYAAVLRQTVLDTIWHSHAGSWMPHVDAVGYHTSGPAHSLSLLRLLGN